MSHVTEDSSNYRPDIDGLRAVAVSLVVVFHLSPEAVPLGFLGVDIFFVISGFVVTLAVLRQRQRSMWEALLEFWKRRVARIYPVLLVSLIATLCLSVLLLPGFPLVVYNGVLRTGAAAVFGLSNMYLHRSGQDYFADNSHNPFLHTWSLGVEEQFYFVYSLIFLLLPLVLHKRLAGYLRLSVESLRLTILLVLVCLSCTYFAVRAGADSIGAYYLLGSRFWELGFGSLLAVGQNSAGDWIKGRPSIFFTGLRWVGIAIFALLFSGIAAVSVFMSILLAAVASLALILGNSDSGNLLFRGLSSRPLVALGRGSYSVYLWHWPVLMFASLTIGLTTAFSVALSLALIGILSGLSYFYIELPIRNHRNNFARLVMPAVGFLVVVYFSIFLYNSLRPGHVFIGKHQDWSNDWLYERGRPYADGERITGQHCDLSSGATVPVSVPELCTASTPGRALASSTTLAIGDSIAFASWPALVAAAASAPFNLKVLTHNGCNINAEPDQTSSSCRSYWASMEERVRAELKAGDTLFLGAIWTPGSSGGYAHAHEKVKKLGQVASELGVRLVVQAPLPTFKKPAYLCTTEWFRLDYAGCSVKTIDFQASRADIVRRLNDWGRENPQISLWDPAPFLCGAQACGQFDAAGQPIFRDTTHLSMFGAKSVAGLYLTFYRSLPASAGRSACTGNACGTTSRT